MIHVREGELTTCDLTFSEMTYLERALPGHALVTRTQLRVQRLAGIWSLPSGRSLVVAPRKGTGADLFAWMCAVDSRLFELAHSSTRAGASSGHLVDVAALTFCHLLSATLQRAGPRRNYAERRTESGSIRGRVDWRVYARRALRSSVPCVYWDRVLDTPLNRLFAKVLRQIAAESALKRALSSSITPLLDLLGHVPPTPPHTILDLERPLPRGDATFESARRLAVVLLECMGASFAGEKPAFSFQVDLARLFERSVERALTFLCSPVHFQFRPPYQGNLDGEGGWSAIDAVVSGSRGRVVIETKYATAFSKSHLYQTLAYMKMIDSSIGVLVYPSGAELPTRRFIADGASRWQVVVRELDPVHVARDGERALREFALGVSTSTGA